MQQGMAKSHPFIYHLKICLYLLYLCKCFACIHVCTLSACNSHEAQKKVSDPIELESRAVVRCHVGAENLADPLEEQPLLITMPCLQLSLCIFLNLFFLPYACLWFYA